MKMKNFYILWVCMFIFMASSAEAGFFKKVKKAFKKVTKQVVLAPVRDAKRSIAEVKRLPGNIVKLKNPSQFAKDSVRHLKREYARYSGRFYVVISQLLSRCENETYKGVDLVCFSNSKREKIKRALDLIDQKISGHIGEDFIRTFGSNPIVFFKKYVGTIMNYDTTLFKTIYKISTLGISHSISGHDVIAYNMSSSQKSFVVVKDSAFFLDEDKSLQEKRLAAVLLHEAAHGKYGAHTCGDMKDKSKNSPYGHEFRFYHYLVSTDTLLPLSIIESSASFETDRVCNANERDDLNNEVHSYYAENSGINDHDPNGRDDHDKGNGEVQLSENDFILKSINKLQVDLEKNEIYLSTKESSYTFAIQDLPAGAKVTIKFRFSDNTTYLINGEDTFTLNSTTYLSIRDLIQQGTLVELTVEKANDSSIQRVYSVKYID